MSNNEISNNDDNIVDPNNEEEISLEGISDRLDISEEQLGELADHLFNEAKNKTEEQNQEEDEITKSAEQIAKDDGKGKQSPKAKTEAGSKLKAVLTGKAAKATLIVGAGVAAVALLLINAPLAIGTAGAILAGAQINKGRKGR